MKDTKKKRVRETTREKNGGKEKINRKYSKCLFCNQKSQIGTPRRERETKRRTDTERDRKMRQECETAKRETMIKGEKQTERKIKIKRVKV